MPELRRVSLAFAIALAGLMLPGLAAAQGAYPTKFVRLIIPFPASTSPDITSPSRGCIRKR